MSLLQITIGGGFIFYQFLAALAAVFYHAASSLPIITALTLISARRGDASFYLVASRRLLKFNLLLSMACPLFLFFNYAGEIAHYHAPLAQQLAPLLAGPGMPWTTSFLSCLTASLFLYFAYLSLFKIRDTSPCFTLKQIRRPVAFLLLAAVAFLATYMLLNWPFGGLPQGLTQEQAALAIFRHAARNYFMAFCPAGAIGLLALYHWRQGLDLAHLYLAVRWFAFWAAAGIIPHWLITWGMRLGLGGHSAAAVAQGMAGRQIPLICLSIALLCWAFLLWKPRYWRSLSLIGFCLFLTRELWPWIKNIPY